MRRRELIALLGATALPPVAMAQPAARVRRIGAIRIKNPDTTTTVAVFEAALAALGWIKGGNLQIEYRVVEPDRQQMKAAAKEIVALAPEVIHTQSTPITQELLRATQTVPIVFVHVTDPIGSGFVQSLAHPGGNVTGFTDIEPSLGGKWVQLLKEVAPALSRAAMMFNPEIAPQRGAVLLVPFLEAGKPLGIQTTPAPVNDVPEIEAAMAQLGAEPTGGLVVQPEAFMNRHRGEILALAARFRVPAIYPYSYYAAAGGLMSYGIDSSDLYRRAATYVDRVLKGANPADLPVQQPTKFELVVNVNTATALGLSMPRSLLQRADEVIE